MNDRDEKPSPKRVAMVVMMPASFPRDVHPMDDLCA